MRHGYPFTVTPVANGFTVTPDALSKSSTSQIEVYATLQDLITEIEKRHSAAAASPLGVPTAVLAAPLCPPMPGG